MNKILQFIGVKSSNHQVHDVLAKTQADYVAGKYGPSTKCIVIIQNPDDNRVMYETCGLHLTEAVGILEIAKSAIMKGD